VDSKNIFLKFLQKHKSEFNKDDYNNLIKIYNDKVPRIGENRVYEVIDLFKDIAKLIKVIYSQNISFIERAIQETISPIQVLVAIAENLNEFKELKASIFKECKILYFRLENIINVFHNSYLKEEILFTKENIIGILDSMKYYYGDRARNKGVDIIINKEDWIPRIESSNALLVRMIANIISNAITYSLIPSKGENKIVITVKINNNENRIIIKINNYGFGILEKEINKIFDAGYQTELSKHMVASGLGLGLFEVRKIVEVHGGNIDFSSNKTDLKINGNNIYDNTFSIKLPIIQKNRGDSI